MYEGISVRDEDVLRIVTMTRPGRRNSLSEAALLELDHALTEAAESDARAVVLAAEGPVFSSGHDFNDMLGRDLLELQRLMEVCAAVMQRIPSMPQPVVGQIEGLATAAGCQLVASCDLAVAGESTSFRLPGSRAGLACTTPAVAVARAVGRKRALEMLLTGAPIDAAKALEWGLVNQVVPDDEVAGAARELARSTTGGSMAASAIAKRAFFTQVDLPLPQAYEYATKVMASAATLPAAQENMAAFVEKRPAVYD